MRHLILLALLLGCCPPGPTPPPTTAPVFVPVEPRLRIVNGCSEPLWIFYTIGGGGTLPDASPLQLAGHAHHDYEIPDVGLASTRFWAGYHCDANGANCDIGQSGPPCPTGTGCAPAVDSKFEGTFGCLPSVPTAQCAMNPSAPTQHLPTSDSWDTSMVDGFTLPFRVHVAGDCPSGPTNGEIDCSGIMFSQCPATENLSTNGQYPDLASLSLLVANPTSHAPAGCFSDCARLTMGQWNPGPIYQPGDPQAQMYCCPTPPISPETCRQGPVASTGYTQLVHRVCPQVYAYGYDDGTGLFSCPAGARYEVTFYCPEEPAAH